MRRRGVLMGLIGLGLAIGTAALIGARHYGNDWATAVLREQGLPVDSLSIGGFGWNGAQIQAVVLAEGHARIGQVDLEYDLRRVFTEHRIDAITLREVEIAGPLPATVLTLAGASVPTLPELPFDRLHMEEVVAHWPTPVGPITLSGDVDAVAIQPQASTRSLQLHASLHASVAERTLGLRLAGRLPADLRGHFVAEVDLVEAPAGAMEGAETEGLIAVTLSPAGLESLSGRVSAAIPESPVGAIPRLTLWGSGGIGLDEVSVRASLADLASRLAIEARQRRPTDQVDLSALLEVHNLVPLTAALDPAVAVEGRGRLAADLAVPLSAILERIETGLWPTGDTVTGRASMQLRRLNVPGWLADGQATISARVSADHHGLRLSADRPWRGSGIWRALAARGDLQIGDTDFPANLAVRLEDGRVADIGIKGAVSALSRTGAVFGGGRAIASFSEDGSLERLGWLGELGALPIWLDGGWVEPRRLAINGSLQADSIRSHVNAEIAVSGTLGPGLQVENGTAEFTGSVGIADGTVDFHPQGCVRIEASRVSIRTAVEFPGGATLCLNPVEGQPLLAAHAIGETNTSLRIAARSNDLRTPFLIGRTDLDLSAAGVEIEADFDLDEGARTARIMLDDAELLVPRLAMALEDLAIGAVINPAADVQAELQVTSGRLRSTEQPEWYVPMAMTASGAVDSHGHLDFRARGTGAGGALRVTARGEIDETGDGQVSLFVAPLSLAPGVRAPSDVFPVLAGWPVREAEGSVSGQLAYGWGTQRRQWARLDLTDIDLFTDNLALDDVTGQLTAARLVPLTLPAGQRLTAAQVDIGLPLQDASIAFGFQGEDRLTVSDLRANLAGGVLRTEPFDMRLGSGEGEVEVRAEGVDMANLVALVDVSDLEATGLLDGRIPIRLTDDTVHIDHAALAARGQGVIRYRGSDFGELGGEDGASSVGLLSEAIQNFHYDELSLGLNGPIGGEMAGEVRIRGANPNLYDGYPISLTMNLSGALSELVRQGLESGRVAERLQDYYQGRTGAAITNDVLDSLEAIQE